MKGVINGQAITDIFGGCMCRMWLFVGTTRRSALRPHCVHGHGLHNGSDFGIYPQGASSSVDFRGIAKKVFIMALVAVGHILDTRVIGDGAVFRSAVIGFYLANEGISILENAGKIGLPLPKKLIDVLAQLKEESKSNDE